MWSATVDAKTLLEGKHYRAPWSVIVSAVFPRYFLWFLYVISCFLCYFHGISIVLSGVVAPEVCMELEDVSPIGDTGFRIFVSPLQYVACARILRRFHGP